MRRNLIVFFEPLFEREVFSHLKQLDPNNAMDILSLVTGWGLAQGMTPKLAKEFAMYIKYHSDMSNAIFKQYRKKS